MKKNLILLLGLVLCFSFSCTKEESRSSEKQILEFSIGSLGANALGVIDEAAKTVTFQVPSGTDVTKLTPMVKLSPSATLAPAIGVEQDFTKPVTYTVTAEDGSKQPYVVTIIVLKSEERRILSFKLAGLTPEVVGLVDEEKKTVLLKVPYGTVVTELVPTITLSKGATVLPAAEVKQDFTKAVTYTVSAENTSKKEAYVVTVEVAKNTESMITEFKFAGLTPVATATIDQAKKTIVAKVPFGTDVTALVPTITISKDATIEPKTDVATDFTSAVTYLVKAQDLSTSSYTVSVVVESDPTALAITSIKETSLIAGLGEIVVNGINLKKVGTTSYIYIGTTKIKGTVNDEGTEIRAKVPSNTPLGAAKVKVQVGVNNNSNELDVTILENTFPAPVVTAVNAVELQAGDVLEITGTNFMKAGNSVRLATTGFPALNYVLDMVSESETSLRFSTAKVVKPGSFDLYVTANGKETKYAVKIKMTLKPAVIAEVSPLKLKAGETITVTGENFSKETLSMILINDGAHKITYVDSKHVTIVASTDLAPGKYVLDIKIGALTASGAPTFKTIYSTDIEIIK